MAQNIVFFYKLTYIFVIFTNFCISLYVQGGYTIIVLKFDLKNSRGTAMKHSQKRFIYFD